MAKNPSRDAVIMLVFFGILGVIALTFNRPLGIGLLTTGISAFIGRIIYTGNFNPDLRRAWVHRSECNWIRGVPGYDPPNRRTLHSSRHQPRSNHHRKVRQLARVGILLSMNEVQRRRSASVAITNVTTGIGFVVLSGFPELLTWRGLEGRDFL